MIRSGRLLKVILIGLSLLCVPATASFADTPAQQIKETVDRIVEILQDPTGKDGSKKAERREMLRQALLPRFDFSEMARRSLGSHWKNQNGRQEEFIAAFTDFVGNAYIIKIESFKGERIIYGRERVDKELAEVETKIVPSKGEPFSINYKFHLVRGEWKIYDVVIENISLVNNYRSQFNRILASASFDELLKKLKERGSEKSS